MTLIQATNENVRLGRSGRRLFAFEIDNFRLSRSDLVEVVRQIEGVQLLRVPKKALSELQEEEFCEFSVGGVAFTAWEPFGDNSRYWIGAADNGWHPEIDCVRQAFADFG